MRFVFKGFPVVGMIEINFVPTFMLKSTARCGRVVDTPTWYFGDTRFKQLLRDKTF
jgi:hypothetical protein